MHYLSTRDIESLLSNFPNTRLSYEAVIHKNDKSIASKHNARAFIIPKGKRCIAWVTEWKRNKIVAVIDMMNPNCSRNANQSTISVFTNKFHQENGWYPGAVRLYDACLDKTLAFGTVFGGIVFHMSMNTYFSIQTIYWYKGNVVPPMILSEHIRLCERMFSEHQIRQVAYTNQKSIIFGLPVLCYSDENINRLIDDLPYPVYAIQYRTNHDSRVFYQLYDKSSICDVVPRRIITPTSAPTSAPAPAPTSAPAPAPTSAPAPAPAPTPMSAPAPTPTHAEKQVMYIQPQDEMLTNIQALFVVRPNIQNDIYELFVRSGDTRGANQLVFHNFAHIPSYKTSEMMNELFRNIAENKRLDSREESDDDFENVEPDRYVSLEKEYVMICRFHKRFCRWVPIQMVSSMKTMPIITYQQVKQHESKYLQKHYKRI
jgi:hypothetical protein